MILLSNVQERFCFAGKVNIVHIHRLQDALSATVKYIEDNELNQFLKKEILKYICYYNFKVKMLLHKKLFLVRYFNWSSLVYALGKIN